MAPGVPIAVIVAILLVTGVSLSNLGTVPAFFIATPVFAALPTAVMPIMLGVLARFDPSGGLAASHPAFIMIAGAVAPFAGGFISDASGGFAANGWFAAACIFVGALLCRPVMSQVRR